MIEKIVMDYLAQKLNISVYAEVPVNEQSEYIVIEKTGGGEEDLIRSATIAVQSYAETLYDAAELNESVVSAMMVLPDTGEVYGCDLNSDYNFTDTRSKRYRYQAVFEIYY